MTIRPSQAEGAHMQCRRMDDGHLEGLTLGEMLPLSFHVSRRPSREKWLKRLPLT